MWKNEHTVQPITYNLLILSNDSIKNSKWTLMELLYSYREVKYRSTPAIKDAKGNRNSCGISTKGQKLISAKNIVLAHFTFSFIVIQNYCQGFHGL
jgi:hypothetical protein